MSHNLLDSFSFDRHALINLVNRKLNSINLKKFPLQSNFENDILSEAIDPDFGYVFGHDFFHEMLQKAEILRKEQEILFDLKFLELGVHTCQGTEISEKMSEEVSTMKKAASDIFEMVENAIRERRISFWPDPKVNSILEAMTLKLHIPTGRYHIFSNGKVVDFEKDMILVREMIVHPRVNFPIAIGNSLSYVRVGSLIDVQRIVTKMYEASETNRNNEEDFNISRESFSKLQKQSRKRSLSGPLEISTKAN